MDWQPGEGSGTGDEPLPGPGAPGGPDDSRASGIFNGLVPLGGASRDERLAGFARGGEWDECLPGPELAAVVAEVAGPEWRFPGAEPDELIGVLRRVTAVESWASSVKLAVTRELIRQDDLPAFGRPRHGDLPDQWSDSVNHELALALACSVQSAEKTALTAWELGARLPGIAALLAEGTLSCAKASLIAETFQLLSDTDAARAEALILSQLTGTAGKTYGQIINLANRAATEVDPGLAERRRKGAVRHTSRVQMFREQSGAAALCGRDLPPDETLAANANVTARAMEYKDSGAFPGARMDQLRSTAYLDLINGRAAHARIALGHLSTDAPSPGVPAPDAPDRGTPDSGAAPGDGAYPAKWEDDGDLDGCDPDGPDGGGGPDGSEWDDDDPSGAPPPGGSGPGGGAPGSGRHGSSAGGDSGRDGSGNSGSCRDDPPSGKTRGGRGPGGSDSGSQGADDLVPPPGKRHLGDRPVPPPVEGWPRERPVLTDMVVPLATLLGLAERPGEAHRLGVLDPGLCRDLATLAAASPHSRLCLTVTDRDGIAIGHGCGRPGKLNGAPPGHLPAGAPPPVAIPARVNLTITADRLIAMLSGAAGPPGKSVHHRRDGRAATGWALTRTAKAGLPGARSSPDDPGPDDPEWCGTWTLTLPSGREFVVRIEPVPVRACDHRHESHGYQPNDALRHLVQVRDYLCTFPSCSRHARESDFEHAQPYHKGGRTCSCNAGARSRKCHRVKQSPGWKVTQPRPGWHVWTTPSGRAYTQAPYRYPV